MTAYVCLLRGINVAGHNKVPMSDIRAMFADLGHADVTTYLQSGNVVFRSAAKPNEIISALEARIARDLKVNVTVLLRTGDQLGAVMSGNPFVGKVPDAAKLHVTFLRDAPEEARIASVPADFGTPDEFRVHRGDVYLHCPKGYGTTKLNNTFWERKLGVAATTRNWNTVNKVHEMVTAAR